MSRVVQVRRPTPQQGRALEILGHAIEYIIDSYDLCDRYGEYTGEFGAVVILRRASMQVFAECEVPVPLLQRVVRLFRHAVTNARPKPMPQQS